MLIGCLLYTSKVGAGMLSQILQGIPTVKDENLLVGYDTSDDAAVYKVSDDLAIVQTLDFFPPIVDDPYMFGQIAAANAISDIYAMGATPKIALNIMTVTPQMSKEMIHEVLRGGYEKAYEAGVIIAGGHTINDQEPKYGLSVTGFARPDEIRMNCTQMCIRDRPWALSIPRRPAPMAPVVSASLQWFPAPPPSPTRSTMRPAAASPRCPSLPSAC